MVIPYTLTFFYNTRIPQPMMELVAWFYRSHRESSQSIDKYGYSTRPVRVSLIWLLGATLYRIFPIVQNIPGCRAFVVSLGRGSSGAFVGRTPEVSSIRGTTACALTRSDYC